MSHPRTHKARHGFTLVELLVVIGIIALLISILLPSLNSARRTAKGIKCLSNLRSLGQAIQLYGNDNKGAIIPCQFYGAAGADPWMFGLVAGRYVPVPSINAADQTAGSNTIFNCPEIRDVASYRDAFPLVGIATVNTNVIDGYDRRYSRVLVTKDTRPLPASASNGAEGAVILDSSYAINGQTNLAGYDDATKAKLNSLPSQAVTVDKAAKDNAGIVPGRIRRFADFKKGSQVILLLDGTQWNLHNSTTNNFWRISGARHGRWINNATQQYSTGTTNVLFLDGHVEGVMRGELPGPKTATPPDTADMFIGDSTQVKNNKYLWNSNQ